MSQCKLLFFVGVFPRNVPVTEPTMEPMISIIWRVNWADGSAAATAEGNAKAMAVNVAHVQGLSGGSEGPNVRYDVYKLHPSIQTREAAEAVLNNPAFDWKEHAIAISLHSVEVGLTNNPGAGGACTVSP